MATLPGASNQVQDAASSGGSLGEFICVAFPAAQNADKQPRIFGSAAAAFARYGYSDGIDYIDMHITGTKKSVIACGVPIATPGVVGRKNTTHGGTSVVSLAAGADGCLGEHDGVLRVRQGAGGTIGTDQIVLEYSCDGGNTFIPYRLGTGNAFTILPFDVDVSFGAGTLLAGTTIATWHGTSPRASVSDLPDVRENCAAGEQLFRSMMYIGDLQNDTEASALGSTMDAFDTAHDRYCFGRASVYDRLPLASVSVQHKRMTGAPSLTFTAADDTCVRASGSWITDGFKVGDRVTISLTDDNNGTFTVESLTATDLVFVENLTVDEVIGTATCVGVTGLDFDNTGETITRSDGSWLDDGFRVGDSVTLDGTVSSDGEYPITVLTPTVMTFGAGAIDADEVFAANVVSVTTGQLKADWMAELDAEFASVNGYPLDLSAGRARVFNPFSGWSLRRPAAWLMSVREYQHDLHVAPWKKELGALSVSLVDSEGQRVEWDDRVDGGAGSAARFTTFRTYSTQPSAVYLTQSLTRAAEASVLSRTNKVSVLNMLRTVLQAVTENWIGRDLVTNEDGTGTESSLTDLESEAKNAFDQAIAPRKEGPRASFVRYEASRTDVLNVAEPEVNGTLEVIFNATIHRVSTAVKIRSGGN